MNFDVELLGLFANALKIWKVWAQASKRINKLFVQSEFASDVGRFEIKDTPIPRQSKSQVQAFCGVQEWCPEHFVHLCLKLHCINQPSTIAFIPNEVRSFWMPTGKPSGQTIQKPWAKLKPSKFAPIHVVTQILRRNNRNTAIISPCKILKKYNSSMYTYF